MSGRSVGGNDLLLKVSEKNGQTDLSQYFQPWCAKKPSSQKAQVEH